MKLEHTFTVPAPVDQAWATLLDIEGVAPCFPGATLTGTDGEEFAGLVKVKLGPVSLSYSGKGRFLERDDEAHTVVLDATGRDKNGNGTAGATVHARMEADGESSTRVVVETDLKVTGRPAQFGRGVIQDVGGRIIGQFADSLAAKMTADGAAPDAADGLAAAAPSEADLAAPPVAADDAAGAPAGPPTLAAATAPTQGRRPPAPRPQPVRSLPTTSGTPDAAAAELDLGTALLPVLLRRFAPPVLVALVAAFVAWRLVHHRRR
ncbi:SRPBCC family protein [Kineosporia sp. A_224]|uniref:SRPBCC family protein n=1 Tax=Kineosporia sp. A_224 TaxID=1962180 RepID=UPI000B4AFEA2|nr:SRPBCC family protein [Kineosporia sp. A_224]